MRRVGAAVLLAGLASAAVARAAPAAARAEGCVESVAPVEASQQTPLGFSAKDVLAAIGGAHRADFAWIASSLYATHGRAETQTAVTLTLAATPSAVRFIDSQGGGCIGGHGPCITCSPRLEIDLGVTLVSDDGALDEKLAVTLSTKSLRGAMFSAELDAAAVRGSYLERVVPSAGYERTGLRVEAGFGHSKGPGGPVPGEWNGAVAALVVQAPGRPGARRPPPVMVAHGYFPAKVARVTRRQPPAPARQVPEGVLVPAKKCVLDQQEGWVLERARPRPAACDASLLTAKQAIVVVVRDYATREPMKDVPIILSHERICQDNGRGCRPTHPHPEEQLTMTCATGPDGRVAFGVPDLQYEVVARAPEGHAEPWRVHHFEASLRMTAYRHTLAPLDGNTKVVGVELVPVSFLEAPTVVTTPEQAIELARAELTACVATPQGERLSVQAANQRGQWWVDFTHRPGPPDRLNPDTHVATVLVNALDRCARVSICWAECCRAP